MCNYETVKRIKMLSFWANIVFSGGVFWEHKLAGGRRRQIPSFWAPKNYGKQWKVKGKLWKNPLKNYILCGFLLKSVVWCRFLKTKTSGGRRRQIQSFWTSEIYEMQFWGGEGWGISQVFVSVRHRPGHTNIQRNENVDTNFQDGSDGTKPDEKTTAYELSRDMQHFCIFRRNKKEILKTKSKT